MERCVRYATCYYRTQRKHSRTAVGYQLPILALSSVRLLHLQGGLPGISMVVICFV